MFDHGPTHFAGHLNSHWLGNTIDLFLWSQSVIFQCSLDFKHVAKPIVPVTGKTIPIR